MVLFHGLPHPFPTPILPHSLQVSSPPTFMVCVEVWRSVYSTRVLRVTEKRQYFCLGLAYFT